MIRGALSFWGPDFLGDLSRLVLPWPVLTPALPRALASPGPWPWPMAIRLPCSPLRPPCPTLPLPWHPARPLAPPLTV